MTAPAGQGPPAEPAGPPGWARPGNHAIGSVLTRLQLLVNRKLDGMLHGDYLGLLPGPGSEPGESREYRPGDDVRRMDWPVTARTTIPHVRQTDADRELTTWLAVDLSASLDFGTAAWLKRDLALAAVAAVTHLTVRGGNRLGALVANGERHWRRPARSGRRAAQGLLRTIAGTPSGSGQVALGRLLDEVGRLSGRRGLVVVISDFLAPVAEWAQPLRRLAAHHDVLAVEVIDPRELSLPDVGVLDLVDPETGEVLSVQTADPKLRERYAQAAAGQRAQIEAAIRHARASQLRLRTDSDWLTDIVRFVAAQRRARHRGVAKPAGRRALMEG